MCRLTPLDPSSLSRHLRRVAASLSGPRPSRSDLVHDLGTALLAVGSSHPRLATLRPTRVSVDRFDASGKDVPVLFHAGASLFTDVTKGFVDGRYGHGFYAAFDPDFVRRWYGPVVTRFRMRPEARVLVASVLPAAAPAGLSDVIRAADLEFLFGGDDSKIDEHMSMVMENPITWVAAVDRLAIEAGFDAVVYCDEQVVVKLPGDPVVVEGEERAGSPT